MEPDRGTDSTIADSIALVARMSAKRIMGHQLLSDGSRKPQLQTASDINCGELLLLTSSVFRQLRSFQLEVRLLGVGLRAHRNVFTGCHRQRTGDQAGNASEQNVRSRRIGRGNTDDKTCG